MNAGITPKEERIVPNNYNQNEVNEQTEAHNWWDKIRSKRGIRAKHRGLTVTQIYKKIVLKKEFL